MKKLKTFSLIEVMLSIAIIGISISSFTLIFFILSKKKESQINQKKFHYIRIAMQNFLLQHGYLPLAAETTNGISGKTHKGYVPYRTLGISKSYMLDAKNKAFIFIINPLFKDTNINLYIPLSYPPKPNEKSFLRLYSYQNNELYYDYFIKNNQLKLFDQKESVISETDYFFVMPPMKIFNTLDHFTEWVASHKCDPRYKVTNVIAWILISAKSNSTNKKTEYEFNFEPGDTIFYQSRFDMAAQIGIYATSEPIYEKNKE